MADLGQFEDAYDQAEAAYVDALRANLPRADLTRLAGEVAAAAAASNTAAFEALSTASDEDREELDRLTDLTETLSELWSDIHAAYQG